MEIDDVMVKVGMTSPKVHISYHWYWYVINIYLLVVLRFGHTEAGTLVDVILQLMHTVEALLKVYDPCGQGVHGSYPVLE